MFFRILKPISFWAFIFINVGWADIPFEDAQSIYERTHKEKKEFSPIWGMTLLKSGVLKNIRLYGNYASTPNEKFPIHPAFNRSERIKHNCPADMIASFIQHLFPSVDGALLTHNERQDDPWGIIAREKDFKFINDILVIILDPKNYQEKVLWSGDYKDKYPRELDKRLSQLFYQRFSSVPQNEGFKELLQSTLKSFIGALDHEKRTIRNIYPKNIVVYSLLAFAWKMADSVSYLDGLDVLVTPLKENKLFDKKFYEENIENFTKALVEPEQSILIPDLAFFTQGYVAYKRPIPELIQYKTTMFQNNPYPNCGETSLLNLFYILLGGQTGIVTKERLEKIQEKIKKNYEENTSSKKYGMFLEFFYDYPSIHWAHRDKTHLAWSEVVSGLNDIKGNVVFYRNGKESKQSLVNDSKDPGTHNLPGSQGIINVLSVIGKLIPDKEISSLWLKEIKDQLIQAASKLDHLCSLFSDKDYEWSWCEIGSEYKELKKSTDTKILFKMNGYDAFIWDITSNHFEIIPIDDQGNDWRTSVSFMNKNFHDYDLFQAWFINDLDINGPYREQIKPYHLWGLDMSNMTVAAKVINFILEKKWENLYPMIPIMVVKSIPLDDPAARDLFLPVLNYHSHMFLKRDQGFLWQALLQVITSKLDKRKAEEQFQTASEYGYTSLFFSLLEQDQSLMSKSDTQGNCAIHIATQKGYWNLIYGLKNEMSRQNKDSGLFPIHYAVQYGRLAIVELMMQLKPEVIYQQDTFEQTPIYYAKDKKTVELLIENLEENLKKKYFNQGDKDKETPLMSFCKKINVPLVNFLLENRVMLDVIDKEGKTAFHHASDVVGCDNLPIIQAFIENMADPRAQDKNGNAPIHLAAKYENQEVLKWFVAQEFHLVKDLNQPLVNKAGDNALHMAARDVDTYGNIDTIDYLIKIFDKKTKNKSQQTPYDLADISYENGLIGLIEDDGEQKQKTILDLLKN